MSGNSDGQRAGVVAARTEQRLGDASVLLAPFFVRMGSTRKYLDAALTRAKDGLVAFIMEHGALPQTLGQLVCAVNYSNLREIASVANPEMKRANWKEREAMSVADFFKASDRDVLGLSEKVVGGKQVGSGTFHMFFVLRSLYGQPYPDENILNEAVQRHQRERAARRLGYYSYDALVNKTANSIGAGTLQKLVEVTDYEFHDLTTVLRHERKEGAKNNLQTFQSKLG